MENNMTLDEAWELIERLNGEAYDYAATFWRQADLYDDEEMRENASAIQQEHFRELFDALEPAVWIEVRKFGNVDEDFKEQFSTYHG
jgi:hypothetical protein